MVDTGFALFVLVVFIAVVFLLEGTYILWSNLKGPETERMRRRIGSLGGASATGDPGRLEKARSGEDTDGWMKVVRRVPGIRVIANWLRQSGQDHSLGRFLAVVLLVAGVATMAALLIDLPWPMALAFGTVAGTVPIVRLSSARRKRLHRFDEQLPDALDLMARALRAGHAFPSAMQMVATECPNPIGSEFHIAFEEINYGVSTHDAMMGMAQRVPSMDLRYFIVSVLLQRETGGNLAELLDNLSHLIRERFKLLGRVRVLAAEGKLSAYILIGLPFATAGMVFVVSPDFISLLWTDPGGQLFSAGAVLLMVVGALVMSKIVRIRV
jgi:tight adherence protein B